MALPLTKPKILPLAEERRRFQRVKVNLLGRYMLEDRREFPCQVINMSPGGMALVAPVIGQPGERVIAYVDHLGRLEGKIARHDRQRLRHDHFGERAQARQARRPAHLARQPAHPQSAGRPPPRPLQRRAIRMARLILPNGNNIAVRVIDLSQSGAAVAIGPDQRPPVGAMVMLGKTQGRVVRHIDDGFAIEFTRLQHPDFIEDNVTGE